MSDPRQETNGEPGAVATVASKRREKTAGRIRVGILLLIQLVMAIELCLLLREKLWISSAWLLAIMSVTSAPLIFRRHLPVRIPLEYELLSILFVFAALFLGEYRSYYERFWWWDIALHGTSGLLLGILGFLLVYVLNEDKRIAMHMRPRFVALFAFAFAVSVGTLWEIFEFGMDQVFGTVMQKPMMGDMSGLTDTMWDLIVDVLGAAVICCFGWWNMKHDSHSFLDRWISRFIDTNPRFFKSWRKVSTHDR